MTNAASPYDHDGDPRHWTLPGTLALAVEERGDQPAIIDGATTLTYGELALAARDFGAALIAAGVQHGDRVAIWTANRAEWIIALFGLSGAGATLVPVNTRFKGAEAATVLSRSGAVALVTSVDFLGDNPLELLRSSGTPLPDLATVVILDGAPGDNGDNGGIAWADFIRSADAASLAEFDRRLEAVDADDVSDLLFTSGTTGVPKGVVQRHRSTMGIGRDWVDMVGLRADDRYLMINPYFHMFGLKAGILASVSAGATMYPVAVFDPAAALDAVATHRITVLPGAPTLYQSILDAETSADLSSLRIAVTGAADIPVPLIGRIQNELPFERVLAGYGLSEAGTATATEPGDSPEIVATTVGRARPGFEVRIVGSDDTDVAVGEPGEILLRSHTIMAGYLDDFDATAAVLDDEGWLRTGDIGTLDAEGRLRIVGRAKDMFIVGGFNVYPAEVENFLVTHPDIAQAAVIGIPDERMGEVAMAFVVAAPGATLDEPGVIAWSREHMANYKAPRRVAVLDSLPLNAAGKVEKLVLKASVE